MKQSLNRAVRTRLGVLALLALVAGLLVPGAVQASGPVAARLATCVGSSCAGKLPQNTGCDADPGLRTVSSRAGYSGVGRVEARFSSECRAFWVRYDPQGALPSCYEIRIQVQTGVRRASGVVDPVASTYRNGDKCAYYWSTMLGSGDGRYARVRSGYLHCSYQDPCDVSWTAWSAWGR